MHHRCLSATERELSLFLTGIGWSCHPAAPEVDQAFKTDFSLSTVLSFLIFGLAYDTTPVPNCFFSLQVLWADKNDENLTK